MMESDYIQIMTDSLIKKITILNELVKLNDLQKDIITAEEFDGEAFKKNMDDKSDQIDEIEKLDQGFNSLFNRVKMSIGDKKEEYSLQIRQIQELIKQITELSVKVQAQENQNKNLLEKKFSSMRKEISSARRSSQMANTYYNNMNKISYEPQLMDQKK